jgi:hypothetical protein
VGRGSQHRPPARPRPRAAWGTPARCRSRARLGLKDRVADPALTRRRVRPQIRLIRPCSCGRAQVRSWIRPCSCGRAHDRSWKCLFAGILGQSFGPRDWATKGAAPSDETTQPAYLQALQEAGATGLEPATSGVTGRFEGRDDWRRWTRNRSIHAGSPACALPFCVVERTRFETFAARLLPG